MREKLEGNRGGGGGRMTERQTEIHVPKYLPAGFTLGALFHRHSDPADPCSFISVSVSRLSIVVSSPSSLAVPGLVPTYLPVEGKKNAQYVSVLYHSMGMQKSFLDGQLTSFDFFCQLNSLEVSLMFNS